MNAPTLPPALLALLDQAAKGHVWLESSSGPDRWMVGGVFNARPCTAAVQCLTDAGLLDRDEDVAVPTDAGRALLADLDREEP